MKKSHIVILAFSILLLVLGLGMTVCGALSGAPHAYSYHHGPGFWYYSVRYDSTLPDPSASAYTSFGHLAFDAGLVLMVIFVILRHSSRNDEELRGKERKAERIDAARARAEAVDAEVHEENGTGDRQ